MEQKHILSFYKSADSSDCINENILNSNSIDGIEIHGDFLEDERFHQFYLKLFEHHKEISSVYGVLPENLTRNWYSASDSIRREIVGTSVTKNVVIF